MSRNLLEKLARGENIPPSADHVIRTAKIILQKKAHDRKINYTAIFSSWNSIPKFYFQSK